MKESSLILGKFNIFIKCPDLYTFPFISWDPLKQKHAPIADPNNNLIQIWAKSDSAELMATDPSRRRITF